MGPKARQISGKPFFFDRTSPPLFFNPSEIPDYVSLRQVIEEVQNVPVMKVDPSDDVGDFPLFVVWRMVDDNVYQVIGFDDMRLFVVLDDKNVVLRNFVRFFEECPQILFGAH